MRRAADAHRATRGGRRLGVARSSGTRTRAARRAGSGGSSRGDRAAQLTHPERVLFADPVITKGDLARFYCEIADFILPGLINRPLMVLRCPEGAGGECFFQKHATPGFPPAIRAINDRASRQRWIYIDSLEGLIGLVQMSALEYHVWGSTVTDLDRADYVVIDLDPGPGVSWKMLIGAALEVRARLTALGLQCFVRTSGGKGLHVVIPVQPATDWQVARGFARRLAEDLAREHPQRYLAIAGKAERAGRIFLDYLRNSRGSTAVCSYSLRNRPGVPIATPLSWEELPRVRAADQFRFATIGRRLTRLGADPWSGIERVRQTLPHPEG